MHLEHNKKFKCSILPGKNTLFIVKKIIGSLPNSSMSNCATVDTKNMNLEKKQLIHLIQKDKLKQTEDNRGEIYLKD